LEEYLKHIDQAIFTVNLKFANCTFNCKAFMFAFKGTTVKDTLVLDKVTLNMESLLANYMSKVLLTVVITVKEL
jgi:hypothetical protein